jgi:photosystem II stability/assembly factor-like uncharacterized protein
VSVREELEAVRAAWGESGESALASGLTYGDGEPVRIRVRKRGHRYDIDDDGAAWSRADASGRAALEAAERVVAEEGFNVNRRGVVFVPAVEGRDIARLAERLAECSLAVYAELLELSG